MEKTHPCSRRNRSTVLRRFPIRRVMTTIRSRCPRCGEVDMSPDQILLHPLRDGHSVYQFTCPACLDPVEKPADRKVAALLVSAGVDFATEDSLLGEALATEPLDGGPMHELIDNSPNGPRVYARRSRGVPFPPDGRGVHRGVPRGAALLAVTPPGGLPRATPARAIEGEGRPRTWVLEEFFLDCSDCGLTVHWVSGLVIASGHWAHREPAPHGEPTV